MQQKGEIICKDSEQGTENREQGTGGQQVSQAAGRALFRFNKLQIGTDKTEVEDDSTRSTVERQFLALVIRPCELVIDHGQARARTPALQPAGRPALHSGHY